MSRSGRVTLSDVQEALSDVRECSEGPPGCPGVVGSVSRMSGDGSEPLRMSGSGRENLPDVREWSGEPVECPGVVERLFRMSGSCKEALPYVRKWSEDPPSCPGVVGGPPECPRLSGVFPGSSGGHLESLRMVGTPSRMSLRSGRPFWMSGSCRVARSDVWKALPIVWKWLGGPSRCP